MQLNKIQKLRAYIVSWSVIKFRKQKVQSFFLKVRVLLIVRKLYMACPIAPFPMTLSDLHVIRLLQAFSLRFLWSPCGIGQTIIFRTVLQRLTRFRLTENVSPSVCTTPRFRMQEFLSTFTEVWTLWEPSSSSLWPPSPCVADADIIFCSRCFYVSSFFFFLA